MLRRDDPTTAATTDGVSDEEGRVAARTAGDGHPGEDRMVHDADRDGIDDRVERTDRHDLDRDGVDDRVERTDRHDLDRDGVDDSVERTDRHDGTVAGAGMGAGAATMDDRHDRDRDGVDDRMDRDDGTFVREDEPIEVVRTRSFSFGQLLTMLAGAALVVLGVVALVDTGVDTPFNEQVGEVLGWSHTALLGVIEIVAGALLILFSLRPGGRWLVAIVGLALLVGGVMILGELDFAQDDLRAEQSFAWVPLAAGAIALLASLLTPRRHQRMTGVPVVR